MKYFIILILLFVSSCATPHVTKMVMNGDEDLNCKQLNNEITKLEQFVDGVPRSILLWELTQFLPEHSILNDIRLETRSRQVEEEKKTTELITILGIAKSDASISEYIDSLSSSEYFSNVSLMYAQQEGDSTRRDFSMQLIVSKSAILAMETE